MAPRTILTTHVITSVGIFHILGDRQEIVTKVNQYLHDTYCSEETDKPHDMWIHLQCFSLDASGFIEDVALNPSQVVMIGRSHPVTVPDDEGSPVIEEGEAEIVLGGA